MIIKLFLTCLVVVGTTVLAQGKETPAKRSDSALILVVPELPWVPPVDSTRQTIFKYLEEKVGHKIVVTSPKPNGLINWAQERRKAAGSDPKALYSAVYELLKVAQPLLQHPDLQQKRRGLWLADYAVFIAGPLKQDSWLAARIYEGYLLSNLEAAQPEPWENQSRKGILQDARGAYFSAGETENEIRVLRVLLALAKTTYAADATRALLAQSLARLGKYSEAIASLQAITDPGISGIKAVIPEYEAELKKQQPVADKETKQP